MALSDGPKPAGLPDLRENRVAVSVFALVVNDDVRLTNLSTADVRRLYRGEIRNWRQLGGPDLPVLLVSRDANSGTRQVFQRRVLGRGEIANSSVDCVHRDDPTAAVIRCELDSTEQVLETVAGLPGAIGYSERNLAGRAKGLHALRLDDDPASVDAIEHGTSDYPYREIEYAYTYGRPPADSLAGLRTHPAPASTQRPPATPSCEPTRPSTDAEHREPNAAHRGSGGRCRGMFGRAAPCGGGTVNRPFTPASFPRPGPGNTTACNPAGAEPPVRNSPIQSAVSTLTSSVRSSENLRSTPRHRSAASPAVPSAGPSTSRTLSAAQSNWSACNRRCTACAVATSRIHPDVTPKYRSTATHAAPTSSARHPQGAIPPATPVRSSRGSATPVTAPTAAPQRSTRAHRRFHTRSARYQAAVRSAPCSTHRYSSSSRSAGSPQSPSGKTRPVRSPGRSPAAACSPRPS
ncbi:PBP superfamily domain-containing protein [Streptomyces sp. Ag82_G6-1]|nr:PBP superfamily domain-containing protein [Streptomyces sp. Ag82_G6-1]